MDGDLGAMWHSQYQPSIDQFPHSITIDTGETTTWTSFDYVPRPVGGTGNGVPRGTSSRVSDDGETWTEVASGEWTTWERQTVTTGEPVTARYLRLTGTSAQNGGPFGGAAELVLWGPRRARSPRRPSRPPRSSTPLTMRPANSRSASTARPSRPASS
ncbi:discoidin domain-containing protein [Agromyces neolithicus]|uniref:discoidin domain-containing protein n=1 Tax=Agromyces neolithicus TaxID=269420 RepID=UPI003CD09FF8